MAKPTVIAICPHCGGQNRHRMASVDFAVRCSWCSKKYQPELTPTTPSGCTKAVHFLIILAAIGMIPLCLCAGMLAIVGGVNDDGHRTRKSSIATSESLESPAEEIQPSRITESPTEEIAFTSETPEKIVESSPDQPPQRKVFEPRTWRSGEFSAEATFVKYGLGKVTIKRADNGKEVTIDMDRLSEEDQAYVKSLRLLPHHR